MKRTLYQRFIQVSTADSELKDEVEVLRRLTMKLESEIENLTINQQIRADIIRLWTEKYAELKVYSDSRDKMCDVLTQQCKDIAAKYDKLIRK